MGEKKTGVGIIVAIRCRQLHTLRKDCPTIWPLSMLYYIETSIYRLSTQTIHASIELVHQYPHPSLLLSLPTHVLFPLFLTLLEFA